MQMSDKVRIYVKNHVDLQHYLGLSFIRWIIYTLQAIQLFVQVLIQCKWYINDKYKLRVNRVSSLMEVIKASITVHQYDYSPKYIYSFNLMISNLLDVRSLPKVAERHFFGFYWLTYLLLCSFLKYLKRALMIFCPWTEKQNPKC